ncbi:MAG: hypothetical protein ABJA79_02650 [Parafilimonas sp.]
MYPILLFEAICRYTVTQAFYNTPLGDLYPAIPFDSLAQHIPKPRRSHKWQWMQTMVWCKRRYCTPCIKILLPLQRCNAGGAAQW